MNEVLEVLVFGERNNVVGNIVCAKVCLVKDMKKNDFIKQLKIHCRKKLENFKIPVKIIIENKNQFNYRFKKNRTNP